jgi:hypothetical protein
MKMAFVAAFRLKSWVQSLLWDIRDILDYADLHPLRLMRKAALQDTVRYITAQMPEAIGLHTARDVLDFALARATTPGHFLEFGVFRGGSIRFIASRKPNQTIHGFDSFEGLPAAWCDWDVGSFNARGRLPKVPRNVALHPGWFNQTAQKWAADNPGPVSFLHIDCDIYSSTKDVFDAIGTNLTAGSVIVFDEYFGYPQWRHHEYKAFQEFVTRLGVNYRYLAYGKCQVVIQLVACGDAAKINQATTHRARRRSKLLPAALTPTPAPSLLPLQSANREAPHHHSVDLPQP